MIIDGFWFDEKVNSLMQDLEGEKANADNVSTGLKLLFPDHRQIDSRQDFNDFVIALNDYRRLE